MTDIRRIADLDKVAIYVSSDNGVSWHPATSLGTGASALDVTDGSNTVTTPPILYFDPVSFKVFASGADAHVATSDALSTILTNLAAQQPLLAAEQGDWLTAGQETHNRKYLASTGITSGSGVLRLSYLTARRSETINFIRLVTGTTPASPTPTLCRVGIYTVAGNGDITLVASSANDTSLFASASTTYNVPLSAGYPVVLGTRYALGSIVISAAATPTFWGNAGGSGAETQTAPRVVGQRTGMSDLPGSVTNAQLNSSPTGNASYFAMTP